MFTVQALAEALLRPDVSVAGLASSLGVLQYKSSDEYRVKVDDPSVRYVSLGIPQGKDASVAPSFVEIDYTADYVGTLPATVPGCTDWRIIPNNPGGSPYLYTCRFPESTAHVAIPVYATLTADIKDPAARIQDVLLQRNVY